MTEVFASMSSRNDPVPPADDRDPSVQLAVYAADPVTGRGRIGNGEGTIVIGDSQAHRPAEILPAERAGHWTGACGAYLGKMPAARPTVFSMPSLAALGASLILCFGIATLGGAITSGPVATWYPALAKPAITPPEIAFPIVWTILFALMAIAAWLVWRAGGSRAARSALLLFGLQLVLNLGWSALFFGAQQIGWALGEIVLLWLAIAATARAFFRHDRRAGFLLLPYLAWVSYAGLLNALIWRLNP